jgi:hypothetical protein
MTKFRASEIKVGDTVIIDSWEYVCESNISKKMFMIDIMDYIILKNVITGKKFKHISHRYEKVVFKSDNGEAWISTIELTEIVRTLIIYNALDEELKYLIVDGDFSRFHGVCVNAIDDHQHTSEFCNWFYDSETGGYKFDMVNDVSVIENKEWDKVAIITWLP